MILCAGTGPLSRTTIRLGAGSGCIEGWLPQQNVEAEPRKAWPAGRRSYGRRDGADVGKRRGPAEVATGGVSWPTTRSQKILEETP
jgi:hypothetical protein